MSQITVQNLVDAVELEVVESGVDLGRKITETFLVRPGMELTGFTDYFTDSVKTRLQLIGTKEWNYLRDLDLETLKQRVGLLFNEETPAIIFSNNFEVPNVMIELAKSTKMPILRTPLETSVIFSKMFNYLEEELSPVESFHGVLVDVNGVGVLITGKSGVGKSETALELIKRGHQLVADDRVDIFEKEIGTVIGRAPEILKGFIEIRGIGIINIAELFGASAYRSKKRVSLVIDLEDWEKGREYNRIGLVDETLKFFETEVAKITIPVKPGRSTASLIEVAAMNHRLKVMGYNAALDFTNRLNEFIKNKKETE